MKTILTLTILFTLLFVLDCAGQEDSVMIDKKTYEWFLLQFLKVTDCQKENLQFKSKADKWDSLQKYEMPLLRRLDKLKSINCDRDCKFVPMGKEQFLWCENPIHHIACPIPDDHFPKKSRAQKKEELKNLSPFRHSVRSSVPEELKKKSPFYHNMSNPVSDSLIPKYLTLSQLNAWWREYEKECYDDSTLKLVPFNCPMIGCATIHNPVKQWVHRQPTFEGFMQYLTKKEKER